MKAWARQDCERIAEAVIAGLEAQRAYLMREDGRFIPNPATWLNAGRWKDQPRANGHDPRRVNAEWGEQPAEGVAP